MTVPQHEQSARPTGEIAGENVLAQLDVEEGGAVLRAVRTSQPCFAVTRFDGPDGPAVLCCTAATSNPTTAASERTGRLEIAPAGEGA